MCAFILSMFCRGFPSGQSACLKNELVQSLVPHLSQSDPLLRQWTLICFASFWENNGQVKKVIYEDGIHQHIVSCLSDPIPEVRASALYAIGSLFGDLEKTDTVVHFENNLASSILNCLEDGCFIVRRELVIALDKFTKHYMAKFVFVASESIDEEKKLSSTTLDKLQSRELDGSQTVFKFSDHSSSRKTSFMSLHMCAWKVLLCLSVDPYPLVSQPASETVDKILKSCLAGQQQPSNAVSSISLNHLATTKSVQPSSNPSTQVPIPPANSQLTHSLHSLELESSTTMEKITKTLRRSASLAFSLFAGSSSHAPAPSNGPLASLTRSESHSSFNNRKILFGLQTLEEKLWVRGFSFFEWSCEYFSEPQMKIPDSENPGSKRYNERLWKRERNSACIQETKSEKMENSEMKHFDELYGVLQDELHAPIRVCFHNYDTTLVSVDPFSRICVYDWKTLSKLNSIMNPNPYGSRISSLGFINEHDISLLYVASDEGMIRLYKDYTSPDSYSLISAWRGIVDFTTMIPPRGTGVVVDWNQSSGSFFIGGHSKSIQVWSASSESCVYVRFLIL